MEKDILIFAFALNNEGVFSDNHFGDTDSFSICKYDKGKIVDVESVPNKFKTADESTEHGSKSKGEGIISHLKNFGVKVLVSKQFGRNIKLVSRHFVPVIVKDDNPDKVKDVLIEHINWLDDAFMYPKKRYKLFNIGKGVMKTIISG